MVRVQDQDAVHGARQDRVRLPGLRRHGVEHVEEVLRVAQVVARIHEGLADRVLVGPGRDGRDLGDQPEAGDLPRLRVVDVEVVVVEGGQRADHAADHRHRVRVAAEAVEEAPQLLMHHGVVGDALAEVLELGRGRQVAFQQQVGDLDEVGVLRQLLDRVAAVQQHAGIAVDIGDLAVAARGRAVAGVEGEDAEVTVELADIDHVRADGAGQHRQARAAVRPVQRDGDGRLCRSGCRAAHGICVLEECGASQRGPAWCGARYRCWAKLGNAPWHEAGTRPGPRRFRSRAARHPAGLAPRTRGRGRPAAPRPRGPQGRAPRRHPPGPSRRRPGRRSARPRRPRRCRAPGHAGPRRRSGRRGRARRPASPGPRPRRRRNPWLIPAASRQLAWPRSGTCSACQPQHPVAEAQRLAIQHADLAGGGGQGGQRPGGAQQVARHRHREQQAEQPDAGRKGQRRPQAGDGARSEDAADAHAARRIVSDTDSASLGSRHCDLGNACRFRGGLQEGPATIRSSQASIARLAGSIDPGGGEALHRADRPGRHAGAERGDQAARHRGVVGDAPAPPAAPRAASGSAGSPCPARAGRRARPHSAAAWPPAAPRAAPRPSGPRSPRPRHTACASACRAARRRSPAGCSSSRARRSASASSRQGRRSSRPSPASTSRRKPVPSSSARSAA